MERNPEFRSRVSASEAINQRSSAGFKRASIAIGPRIVGCVAIGHGALALAPEQNVEATPTLNANSHRQVIFIAHAVARLPRTLGWQGTGREGSMRALQPYLTSGRWYQAYSVASNRPQGQIDRQAEGADDLL
jgi:hypothetical protein